MERPQSVWWTRDRRTLDTDDDAYDGDDDDDDDDVIVVKGPEVQS
jgi:hypothetical protein